jgi:signal transduction histidine kinase
MPAHPDPLDHARHGMKTPLTVIKGTAQLAARDVARCRALPDPEREKLLARMAVIEAAVAELARQVDDLRAGGDAEARDVHMRS